MGNEINKGNNKQKKHKEINQVRTEEEKLSKRKGK